RCAGDMTGFNRESWTTDGRGRNGNHEGTRWVDPRIDTNGRRRSRCRAAPTVKGARARSRPSGSGDVEGPAELVDGGGGHGDERTERAGEEEGLGGGFEDFEAVEGFEQGAAGDHGTFVFDEDDGA